MASFDSLRLADQINSASKRDNAPVTKEFVRPLAGGQSMFRQLYVGGRSGTVAIKLYLGLLWRCSGAPYESREDSAYTWALLLDLPNPKQNGTRRIREARKKLQDLQLITMTPVPGSAPTVRLLAEDGSGEPYNPPANRYIESTNRSGADQYYFKVSGSMWLEGQMQELSGPALAMYLILASERAYAVPQWFSTAAFPERYGLSSRTRALGTEELRSKGLLKITSKALDERNQVASFTGRVRMRKVYALIGNAIPLESP